MEIICFYLKKRRKIRTLFTKSDAVGPFNVVFDKDDATGSIKPALLNFRLLPPVCPVHEAKDDKAELLRTESCGVNRQFISSWIKLRAAEKKSCLLIEWVDCDGSRLPEVLCDERPPLTAICGRHGDGFQNAVSPIDVAVDPIHCDTVGGLNPAADHNVVTRDVVGHVYAGAVGKETTEGTYFRASPCQHPSFWFTETKL